MMMSRARGEAATCWMEGTITGCTLAAPVAFHGGQNGRFVGRSASDSSLRNATVGNNTRRLFPLDAMCPYSAAAEVGDLREAYDRSTGSFRELGFNIKNSVSTNGAARKRIKIHGRIDPMRTGGPRVHTRPSSARPSASTGPSFPSLFFPLLSDGPFFV